MHFEEQECEFHKTQIKIVPLIKSSIVPLS